MGRAHIHADASLLARLLGESWLRDLICVANAHLFEAPALYLAEVSSPLLPTGNHGMQSVIIDGNHVRFKKDCDV